MPITQQKQPTHLKLKKGDLVRVLTGKDRGKEGEIVRAIPEKRKVIVAGVNVSKRHQRSGQRRSGDTASVQQGGIIDKDMPLPISSVALVCPTCGPTRVGYRVDGEGRDRVKIRICRKCEGEV